MDRPKFEIVRNDRGIVTRVFMDGEELKGAQAVTVEDEVRDLPKVTIRFVAGGVTQRQADHLDLVETKERHAK